MHEFLYLVELFEAKFELHLFRYMSRYVVVFACILGVKRGKVVNVGKVECTWC